MGCGNSSASKPVTTTTRRRLSVGQADTSGVSEADTGGAEDDRGMITALNEKSLMEMMAEANVGTNGRKMSIGSETDQGKTSFANKAVAAAGDEIDTANAGLGFTCRKGLKPEAPNQDSWFILKLDTHSLYAVFDGHGQKGHDVSNFVKDNLPKLIIKDQRFRTDDQGQMLIDLFKRTQNLVTAADRTKKLSAQMSGTTCSVCIHKHADENDLGKITVAHVADSTIVLGGTKDKKVFSEQLTRDHKPNLKDERQRIEKAGGRVVFDGYANHRVYAKGARYPGLNMSRCMGDLLGHQDCGLSAEPEIKERPLDSNDQVLLVCSDGVWEFMEPKAAVEFVLEYKAPKAMLAAEKLAKEAWDRWIREEGGAVVDDITVVLIYLQAGRSSD